MGGQKFEYDESGSTFFYFVLSFLALVLIPATFYYWPRKKKEDPAQQASQCQCPNCVQKRIYIEQSQPYKGLKNLLVKLSIIAGWVILGLLAYKVSQFDYEMSNFDPYEIMGISPGATQAEIKKSYRKQSLVLHPDKETGDEKAFMRLTKAYQALTDDEARRNWEKYGNPDGPGAMSFGIALPSWIVEKENSVWVLGLYAAVFMLALPIAVGTWWYRSIRFSGEQVLLDTTQLYFYFFHKTPSMPLKRALMILAASCEFDRRHNSEIIERVTDNEEVPQLLREIPNLGEKNREQPLCRAYSIKARALLHAHLSRLPVSSSLARDQRYIVSRCPDLINEMVNCVNQLIALAYARRISRLPSIETLENCMRLSPMVVQALWEHRSPLMQLPHMTEELVRALARRRGGGVKSPLALAQLAREERRTLLRALPDVPYAQLELALAHMPYIHFNINTEVIDDENSAMVTAGAIVTVTVTLRRQPLRELFGDTSVRDKRLKDTNGDEEGDGEKDDKKDEKSKRPVWMKSAKRPANRKAKKPAAKPQTKPAAAAVNTAATSNNVASSPTSAAVDKKTKDKENKKSSKDDEDGNESSASASSDVEADGDGNANGNGTESEAGSDSDNDVDDKKTGSEDDDDSQWEKFQQRIQKRERLEGLSKCSHPVHCPFYPQEKQEYWWVYVCDRKSHTLLTAPAHVTSLVEEQEVRLRFTAPRWPGVYTLTAALRSDSYIGMDQQQEMKLDVKEAAAVPTEHPQWDLSDSDTDKQEQGGDESEYTSDELEEEDD